VWWIVIGIVQDDGIRPGTTKETLAKVRPAFPQWGRAQTTGGNASQITDGVAAVLMMTRRKAEQLGLPILAKHVTTSVAGKLPLALSLQKAHKCYQGWRRGSWGLGRRLVGAIHSSFKLYDFLKHIIAIPMVLERVGITKEDVDLWEVLTSPLHLG
jgi:acetyl-CoA acyltransferase 1